MNAELINIEYGDQISAGTEQITDYVYFSDLLFTWTNPQWRRERRESDSIMKEGFVCISYLLSQGLAITANIISCLCCHIQLVNLFIYQLLSYYHNTGISFPDFLQHLWVMNNTRLK